MSENPANNHRILLIGDSCIDKYVFGSCERLSPEDPVPIFVPNEKIDERPGMSSNVFSNMKSLGDEVVHITHDEKIIKTRYVAEGYANLRNVLRVDQEPQISTISIESLPRNISSFDAIVISDYDKGFLTHDSCKKICEIANDNEVKVFVDSKKPDLSCFENSILKINQFEQIRMKKLPQRYQLIITRGSSGAEYMGEIIPPFIHRIVDEFGNRDVCGAGDTFLSGLVHEYLRTEGDIRKSIEFANKCAAIVVSKFGTSQITRDDLDALEER